MDYLQNLSESDRQWYDLIQQCRTSGKSDRQWLAENNISSPSFYYHVKQLRKKACEIPKNIYSCISEKQDVVPLVIHDLPLEKNNTVFAHISGIGGTTPGRTHWTITFSAGMRT